jgi:hypothetical protein
MQYFAPSVEWKATPKFKVIAGVMFIHGRYNLQPQTGRLMNQSVIMNSSGDMFTNRLAASGVYTVNSKLTIAGSLVSDFASASSGYSSNPYRMMSLDMNYKLSESVKLGASVRMIQTEYRFLPYGLYNSSVNNSFTDVFGNY